MLKQLLKYEFKATKRRYFGLYLALALLSVVLGVTFRQEHALAHSTSFQNLEVILMIVYVSVILAIAVLCFVNTIQRFYQNLLGREGYLMHTLPVNENQLILSKLLTSMVWVLCSGLVGIVCITVMVSIGVIDSETFGMVDWNSWKQLWQMLYVCSSDLRPGVLGGNGMDHPHQSGPAGKPHPLRLRCLYDRPSIPQACDGGRDPRVYRPEHRGDPAR